MRTVAFSLPCAANSGQYSATGASMSSSPRDASTCAQIATAPLVQENTIDTVSRVHGTLSVGRAMPPQRSTTVRPSWCTQTDAPTSARSRKLRSNSSATATNLGSQLPSMLPFGISRRMCSIGGS